MVYLRLLHSAGSKARVVVPHAAQRREVVVGQRVAVRRGYGDAVAAGLREPEVTGAGRLTVHLDGETWLRWNGRNILLGYLWQLIVPYGSKSYTENIIFFLSV